MTVWGAELGHAGRASGDGSPAEVVRELVRFEYGVLRAKGAGALKAWATGSGSVRAGEGMGGQQWCGMQAGPSRTEGVGATTGAGGADGGGAGAPPRAKCATWAMSRQG